MLVILLYLLTAAQQIPYEQEPTLLPAVRSAKTAPQSILLAGSSDPKVRARHIREN